MLSTKQTKQQTTAKAMIGLIAVLAISPLTQAQETLEDFESYSDNQVIGNSFTNLASDSGSNNLAAFGQPLNLDNDIRATTSNALVGGVGAQFTPVWSQATSASETLPHFAGVLLDLVSKNGVTSDLSGKSVGSFYAQSDFAGTLTELALVIGDGHTTYGAKVRQLLTNTAEKYTFSLDADDMELTDFLTGATPHDYSVVLSNAQFIGLAAFRTTASIIGDPGDTETIYFDQIAVPEPASATLLVAGLCLIGSSRFKKTR